MLDCIIYGINGIANNNLFYLIEEIKAGKTSNKTFLGMMQLTLNCVCFMPAYKLFTHTPFWLKCVQYSLAGLIVIANYLSFVYESNGISDGPKKTLPLGLEDNTLLKNIAHFISQYIHWLQITIFISSLVIAAAYGMTQLVIFSLIGVLLEQIYQRNLLPSMLASLYRLTRIGLLGGLILGWDNYFFLAINLLNIIFIFGDYILTHLLGVTTASVQYPISRKSNTFSFEDSGLDKPNNQEDLLKFLGQIKALPVELTFDHMRQSSRIIEEISQNAKPVNYDDFLSLFKQVNFQDKELRACIEAEITANDDYMLKVKQKNFSGLELPPNPTAYDIMMSYLRQEIFFMVERLKSSAPRNLNIEQLAILKGQGRLILEHLKTFNSQKNPDFSRILIELALRTGSHCSRVYLKSFSEMMLRHQIQGSKELNFKERVIVHTQEIKNIAFTNFYYRFTTEIKNLDGTVLNLLWSDSTDYHSFEHFALNFGAYFYLDNPTYSIRFRGILDIIQNVYTTLLLGCANPIFLFSNHYHHDLLIQEVIQGKLSADFNEWCQTFYPDALRDLCMDEDYLIDPENPNTIALATLMLLDCNIIQFKEPKSLVVGQAAEPSLYQRSCAAYHGYIQTLLKPKPF